MQVPSRILVRSPNWIGDQILAYPFFYFLRRTFPKSTIAVSCVPWVRSLQFKNLVDEVYPLPQPENASFQAKWKALEAGAVVLKARGPWDLGICLPNSFSSAWLLYRSKVLRRRGYAMDGRGFLLHEALPWQSSLVMQVMHRAEAYAQLLPVPPESGESVVGFWGVYPQNELDPKIPGILSEFDVQRAWPDACPMDPPQGSYWVLAPGSTAESRRWPLSKWIALARQIVDTTGWPGVVVGGVAESKIAQSLIADPSLQLSDWTARGAVTDYWRIFRQTQFTVSNDSGLAHVAALCGSFVHVVWGAGHPKRTEPLGPGKVQLSFNPVDCWPCESNTCSQLPPQKLACLQGISADAVWKEIQTGIQTYRSC